MTDINRPFSLFLRFFSLLLFIFYQLNLQINNHYFKKCYKYHILKNIKHEMDRKRIQKEKKRICIEYSSDFVNLIYLFSQLYLFINILKQIVLHFHKVQKLI